jgi:hypothetical protein
LLLQLASIDISVPDQTDGRTTSHREQYMVARLLATLAETDQLSFPLQIDHREKPDFALHLPHGTVGIECVEAVSEEWAQIRAIRERDFPDAMIFLPMLKAGEKKFSLQERIAIARGDKAGPPWVGGMAERQWAEAHAYFIADKTEKLRRGNYSDFTRHWLLIQDEWTVPMHRVHERHEAAELCATGIQPLLEPPSFSHIFISNSSWLIRLAPAPVHVYGVRDLWN